jgi:D-aspartate ligase
MNLSFPTSEPQLNASCASTAPDTSPPARDKRSTFRMAPDTSSEPRVQFAFPSDEERRTLGVVVTGADYRALGVVRSLGRRNIPVCVLKQRGHGLAARSRYATRSLNWPDGDDESRIRFLIEQSEKSHLRGWLLIPTDDDTVAFIARHHSRLATYYRLTTAPDDQLRLATNKQFMYQLGERLDIPQPRTYFPLSHADIASLGNCFPAILKPITRAGMAQLTNAKAWRVDNQESLEERYRALAAMAGPDSFMVQELIPGGGDAQFSHAALCLDGRTVAAVTARRLRQIPMDFGRFSTYVETVAQPEVADLAERLLRALNFNGLVEVEFKRDPRDGAFKLLDVNARVWGWHSLCQRAAVDFPYLLWLQTLGQPISEVRPRIGVRWMRLSADVMVAATEMLHGRLTPAAYWNSLQGPRESAIFAADDPLPGLLEFPLALSLMLRQSATRIMSRRLPA